MKIEIDNGNNINVLHIDKDDCVNTILSKLQVLLSEIHRIQERLINVETNGELNCETYKLSENTPHEICVMLYVKRDILKLAEIVSSCIKSDDLIELCREKINELITLAEDFVSNIEPEKLTLRKWRDEQ